MISCRDWLPWTKICYIIVYRRQSNDQGIGGTAAHPAKPQNFPRANSLENCYLPRNFEIKTASSSLTVFHRAKLSTRSITHLCSCWKLKEILRNKANPVGMSKSGFCSWTTIFWLNRHLQPRRNWPTWPSNVLITHFISRIWHRRATSCSLDWKNIWNFDISFRRSKKCIEVCGEYVENILSLLAVACFLPGRAKDL